MAVRILSDAPCPVRLMEEGYSIRILRGRKEHPRKLLQEILYGSWVTTGSPQAFAIVTDDGDIEVLAITSGEEKDDEGTVAALYDVVDLARGRQGIEPIFRAPW